RLAGADQALLLGVLDERSGDAVLDRAGRVERLHLGPQPDAGLGAQAPQLDQRRVADRLDEIGVPAPAGTILERREGHFTKDSARVGPAVNPGTAIRSGLDRLLERRRGLEAGHARGGDLDGLAGLRVAPLARGALGDGELPEAG